MSRHTLRSTLTLALAAAAALATSAAFAAETRMITPTGSHIRQEAQVMAPVHVGGATQAERAVPLDPREAARPQKPDLPSIDESDWTAQSQPSDTKRAD